MGFELVDRETRSLPPIQTPGIGVKPTTTSESSSKSTSDEEGECVTPRSSGQPAVKQALGLVCPPPPPRKPRPVKRRLAPPPDGYYPVPSDLASIFVPVPMNKKIRVGWSNSPRWCFVFPTSMEAMRGDTVLLLFVHLLLCEGNTTEDWMWIGVLSSLLQ